MAVINLYKDLENKKIERIQCSEGLSIREVVGEKDWKNCIILANGKNVDENYLIKKEDLINIKQYPSAITATVMAIDYAIGGPISSSIKDHFKDEVRKEASNMLGDLKAPNNSVSNNNVIGQAEQLPTIRGASNQNANGKPVPFCIGETLFSPYVCGNGYSIISGDDGDTQHFIFMLQLGYSDITVKKIRMGFLNIASNPSGEIPSGHFLDIDGNFRFREGGENVTQLELLGSGEDSTLYPQRVKQTNYKDHIIHTPTEQGTKGNILKLDKFTELNPQRVEVEISFDKLFQKNEKNELADTSVEIGIAISYDDGKTWKPFNQITGSNSYRVQNVVLDDVDVQAGISGEIGISTITRNKNKNLRFVATQTMTYDEVMNAVNRVGIIRVVRINEENLSTNFQDVAYLTAIRTYTFDYRKSLEFGLLIPQSPVIDRIKNKTTRLAVKVKATEFIRNSLDKIDCIIEPKCRIWNGLEWSTAKSATSNPASSLLNMWEHPMIGSNAYTDKDFDLEQLGVLYDFCEEKGIKISGILTGQKKIRDITNTILANCRSALVLRGNKYSVWIDKPQLYPVTVLNNHNILKGGASNNKEFAVLPDAYLVKMVDRANDYQEAEFYVIVKDGADLTDPTTVIESISLQYITDYQQAYKFILYYHATRKLRPETWLRKQGIEGNLVEIGDMVEIQDDTISVGIGDGGEIIDVEIEQGFIVAIYTDSKFNIADLSQEYAVTLNSAEGTRTDIVVFNSVEYTNKLYFATPVSLDDLVRYNIGDVISFGIYQKVTAQALVMGKKENPDQTFDLNLVPYQEGVYTADTGVIPEYDPKTTGSQPAIQTPVIPIDFSKIPLGKDGINGKDGKSGLTVIPEKTALVYNADSNGKVENQVITNRIRIEQEGVSVPFTIGKITNPSGFVCTSIGSIVTIEALEGVEMAKNGLIRIPISYRPIVDFFEYTDENGDKYTDENGDVYTYIKSSETVANFNLYISYAKAIKGDKGNSVKGIEEWYLATDKTEVDPKVDPFTLEIQTVTKDNPYLWNYERTFYADGTLANQTDPVIIGTYGKEGKGIKSIEEFYLTTDKQTGVTKEEVTSTSFVPTTDKNKYLWNKERITYTDGDVKETDPVIIGTHGTKGDKGDKGGKGDTGNTGDRGARYWGTSQPYYPVTGDFYLDISTMYLKEWVGYWNNIPYYDNRYNQAITDMIKYASSAGESALAVVNAWVENLVTGTILAERIFTKELTIKEGGLIKSENYVEDKAGFKVDTEGVINANKGQLSNIEIRSEIYDETKKAYLGLYSDDYGKIEETSWGKTKKGFNLSSVNGNGKLECSSVITDSLWPILGNHILTYNMVLKNRIIEEDWTYFNSISTLNLSRLETVLYNLDNFFGDILYHCRTWGDIKLVTGEYLRVDYQLVTINSLIVHEHIDDYFMEFGGYSCEGQLYIYLKDDGLYASGAINGVYKRVTKIQDCWINLDVLPQYKIGE